MRSNESALIVPALELASLVGSFRLQYAPGSQAGMPPHITVLYPFVDPSQLTADVLTDLDELLQDSAAFEYTLIESREFGQGILYLAPEPAERFIKLTELASSRFGIQPFGGVFPTVVPHLTITQTAPEAERRRISSLLTRALPRTAQAAEAWVMVGTNDSRWRAVHITRFGGGPSRESSSA